jgi:hypothetical protein
LFENVEHLHWHDGADEPHQREAGSKAAAIVEYVSLIPRPFCHLHLAKAMRTFTEIEKGMALEELHHMRTLVTAVRELKRKYSVK